MKMKRLAVESSHCSGFLPKNVSQRDLILREPIRKRQCSVLVSIVAEKQNAVFSAKKIA